MEEIQQRIEVDERVLVTTLTKRMAEELDEHLRKWGVRSAYIHSDVTTLDRIQILEDLRNGVYDVLIGVNLLREGLDLPQVGLVAILDADKEGFLRNHRSLTQTAGRAARNVHGKVIMYADKITDSMRLTIEETERRRAKQMRYNEEHGIVPMPIIKTSQTDLIGIESEQSDRSSRSSAGQSRDLSGIKQGKPAKPKIYIEEEAHAELVADPVIDYLSADELRKRIERLRADMTAAARKTDFIEAAQLRDEIMSLTQRLESLNQ